MSIYFFIGHNSIETTNKKYFYIVDRMKQVLLTYLFYKIKNIYFYTVDYIITERYLVQKTRISLVVKRFSLLGP